MRLGSLTTEDAQQLLSQGGMISAADVAAELRRLLKSSDDLTEFDPEGLYYAKRLGTLTGSLSGLAALLEKLGES